MEAQHYLETELKDKDVKFINLNSLEKQLTGELNIENYLHLEEIDLNNHELSSLIINNCPKLKRVNVRKNQLTKLEIKSDNIEEIIGGSNKLSSLDLSDCNKVKKLILPDNPFLIEIKNFNLENIKEFNITNTSVKLVEDNKELNKENENLYKALEKIKKAISRKEIMIADFIKTPKQAEKEMESLLKKTKDKWKKHFSGKEKEDKDPFLEVNLDSPEKEWQARRIFIKIIGTLTTHDYEKLAKEWNKGETYNADYDFDGDTLARLTELLKTRSQLQKSLKKDHEC